MQERIDLTFAKLNVHVYILESTLFSRFKSSAHSLLRIPLAFRELNEESQAIAEVYRSNILVCFH